MAYQDLTPEEQATLQEYVQTMRSWTNKMRRLMNSGYELKNYYDATAFSILQQLLAGDNIPNESGLAGATAVSQSECNELQVNHINAVRDEFDTTARRQLYSYFGGLNNSPTV